jgi:hypothetical protein
MRAYRHGSGVVAYHALARVCCASRTASAVTAFDEYAQPLHHRGAAQGCCLSRIAQAGSSCSPRRSFKRVPMQSAARGSARGASEFRPRQSSCQRRWHACLPTGGGSAGHVRELSFSDPSRGSSLRCRDLVRILRRPDVRKGGLRRDRTRRATSHGVSARCTSDTPRPRLPHQPIRERHRLTLASRPESMWAVQSGQRRTR